MNREKAWADIDDLCLKEMVNADEADRIEIRTIHEATRLVARGLEKYSDNKCSPKDAYHAARDILETVDIVGIGFFCAIRAGLPK